MPDIKPNSNDNPAILDNLSKGSFGKCSREDDTEFPQFQLRTKLVDAESASGETVFSKIQGVKSSEYECP